MCTWFLSIYYSAQRLLSSWLVIAETFFFFVCILRKWCRLTGNQRVFFGSGSQIRLRSDSRAYVTLFLKSASAWLKIDERVFYLTTRYFILRIFQRVTEIQRCRKTVSQSATALNKYCKAGAYAINNLNWTPVRLNSNWLVGCASICTFDAGSENPRKFGFRNIEPWPACIS